MLNRYIMLHSPTLEIECFTQDTRGIQIACVQFTPEHIIKLWSGHYADDKSSSDKAQSQY